MAAQSDIEESFTALDDVENRRKRLHFRCWHRGTREADLFIGSFADRYLPEFNAEELDQFEALLCENDVDIYNWMTEREPVPPEHDNAVTRLLRQFDVGGALRSKWTR